MQTKLNNLKKNMTIPSHTGLPYILSCLNYNLPYVKKMGMHALATVVALSAYMSIM